MVFLIAKDPKSILRLSARTGAWREVGAGGGCAEGQFLTVGFILQVLVRGFLTYEKAVISDLTLLMTGAQPLIQKAW